jgi:hypothetical protein
VNQIGPNVKKLIFHKMSQEAIPKGGGVADGLKFLMDKERIQKSLREAAKWIEEAILSVRSAAEPNPLKAADDETIAAEILRRIEEKAKKRKP